MSKTKNINKKAENIVDNFLASKFVVSTILVLKVAKELAQIYVPLGVAVYILHTQNDKFILGLGVASALLSLVNTFKVVIASVVQNKNSSGRK